MVRPSDRGPGSAELSSAEPHVLVNTARARIDVRVCERRGTEDVLSYAGSLEPYCSRLTDVDGATLTWNDNGIGDRDVLMTIRPRQVGEVRVKGIDLTYTHGMQSGTQQVGDHVWFRYVSSTSGPRLAAEQLAHEVERDGRRPLTDRSPITRDLNPPRHRVRRRRDAEVHGPDRLLVRPSPGPATPVMPTPTSAPSRSRAPAASASATSALTAPTRSIRSAGTPARSCLAWLE